jgi:membrane protease subunit HflK
MFLNGYLSHSNRKKWSVYMAWNEPGDNEDKDSWGRRKDEQGPPDLDEIFRRLKNKLNRLLGGGGSSRPPDEEGVGWTVVVMILIFVLGIWSLFGLYIIQPAEQGIETRFGRYKRTTMQGWHWHLPFPIESAQTVNVDQYRTVEHKALMLTKDENLVNIELIVQYKILDSKNYLFNVVDPDKTLYQATESALREIVGTSLMDDILTRERDRVAADTRLLIQEIIDRYEAGLTVTSVNMQDAQPPEEVQAAFADVIKAREDKERSKNKAEAYANEIVERAGGTADKLRQEAQAYKSQIVARAEGETRRFLSVLEEYEKAPEVTRQRLYLETMESVLSHTSKVILDINNGNNITLLPLKLDDLWGGEQVNTKLPRSSLESQQMSSQSDDSKEGTQRSEDMRSRDNARNRERR